MALATSYRSGRKADQSLNDRGEPVGFVNRTDSEVTLAALTRTLTLQPKATSYAYWNASVRFEPVTPKTSVWADTSGWHYFWLDSAGVLQNSMTFPGIDAVSTLVFFLLWDSAAGAVVKRGDERHGINKPSATHRWEHVYVGTQVDAATFGLTASIAGGSPASDDDTRVYMNGGEISDEDNVFEITNSSPAAAAADFEQELGNGLGAAAAALLPILYRDGAAGDWKLIAADAVNRFPYPGGVSYPQWNEWTGATWQLTDGVSNRRMVMWICATNDPEDPVFAIPGQAISNSLNDVDEDNNLGNFDWGNAPFAEIRVLYRIVLRTRNSYSTTHNCKVERVDDYRAVVQNIPTAGGGGANPHSAFTGLDFDASGHTGFTREVQMVASAPTANNDEDDTAAYGVSFAVGNLWFDTATNTMYVCKDATATAAVWQAV